MKDENISARPKVLMTIFELAEYTGTKASFLYEKSRHNEIPGQYRIGSLVRVDLDEFLAATKV